MKFLIDYNELDMLGLSLRGKVGAWGEQLVEINEAFGQILQMDDFRGQSADNVKHYLSEVYGTIFLTLVEIFDEITSRYTLFSVGYHRDIDTDLRACLSEDDCDDNLTFFSGSDEAFEDIHSVISALARDISDIMPAEAAYPSEVRSSYQTIGQDLYKLRSDVNAHEQYHLANDFTNFDEMMTGLCAFIDEKLSRTTGMQHHVEGSTFSTASFQSLLPALQTAHQERDAIRDEVAIAAMYEQARFDALVELWSQERTERGVLQWVVGGLVVIGGVAAIVLTAGMATPFVVAGVVAGTAAIAYGASEMREGQHNVALGMAGDPFTSAFNPLRDTIFMGNQQAYDIFGMVAVASTAVVSLGAGAVNVGVAATNAGTSVLRAVCVYAGKVAISGGAGYLGAFGSRELALHFGASETMADLAGVFGGLAAGTAAGLGTHAMDRRLNVSGFHRRPIDPSFSNINGEVNSIDLPEGTWDQGPTARGQTIDQAAGNNTGRTFPVVDRIDERGVVTSIKSRDLRAPTYQRASRLESTIRTDINKVAGFQGADRTASGGIEIRSADITGRQLQVVVPNAPISNSQVQAINNAITHGQSRGVNVIITIGR